MGRWIYPPPETPQPTPGLLHRCAKCGSVLLKLDFLSCPVAVMDRALERHSRGLCVSDDALADEVTASLSAEEAGGALWANGEPPLVHLIRCKRSDAVLALLEGRGGADGADGASREALLERCGGVNTAAPGGVTALHVAAEQDAAALVGTLLSAGACATAATTCDDVHAGVPGGRTALHSAAAAGASEAAAVLLRAAPELAAASDWEGRVPAELAWLLGGASHALALTLADAAVAAAVAAATAAGTDEALARDEMEERLEEVRDSEADNSDRQHARTLRRVELRERKKEALGIESRPRLHACHLLTTFWSAERCAALLRDAHAAASLHGWTKARHRHYATTDVPLWRVSSSHAWVRAAVDAELLPALGAAYGILPSRLALREAFVVLYDHEEAQRSLALHKDGTLLACTVLLNEDADFDGGGTCFGAPTPLLTWSSQARSRAGWAEVTAAQGLAAGAAALAAERAGRGLSAPALAAMCTSATLVSCVGSGRGDVLLQCGQHKHGGAPITRGRRSILVCFVDELRHDPTSPPPADEACEPALQAAEAAVAADAAAGEGCADADEARQGAAGAAGAARVPGLVHAASMPTPARGLRDESSTPSAGGGGVAGGGGAAPSLSFAVGGRPNGTPGACLSSARSKKSLKRTNTTPGSLATPGSGRRIISFGTIEEPGSSAQPERKGRYTLPGGRPAFAPGWDQGIDVSEPETEAADVAGDKVAVTVTVDGRVAVDSPGCLLSSSGEASLRLHTPMRIHSARSVLEARICEADGTEACCVRTEPPTDIDEWVAMPGAKRGMRSLSLDAPGFTIVFDAASETSDAGTDLAGGWAGDDEGDDEGQREGGPTSCRLDLTSAKIVRQGKKP